MKAAAELQLAEQHGRVRSAVSNRFNDVVTPK
jgi:hypothetical protein